MWINANREELCFDSMSKEYKQNCYRTLEKERENIKRVFFLSSVQFNKADFGEIRQEAIKLY